MIHQKFLERELIDDVNICGDFSNKITIIILIIKFALIFHFFGLLQGILEMCVAQCQFFIYIYRLTDCTIIKLDFDFAASSVNALSRQITETHREVFGAETIRGEL